ncbi:SpaA isopeptide-forming pilin-related protein [Leuconostoc falkenbergense]|uniref:SpaA isopeptide-forming pilin-related protein n=1 Tax=Leuconostoc falkenbergense TaxID=2766470 RepID=A0ABT7S0K3_9LACO|nr:SpaA isopeptide-forming pilin-related protein [Leuconostoc falkenbergense]MDM7647083.1 SpaA isopeptide-forming pilin-related protein [Leuconostoc falkenbergense]MDY5164616.1 SpaA isopeptide-forming pilin-related protein [Leuconostoc falkenbergense]
MKKTIHKNLRNKFVHFLGIALLMGSIVTSSFLQPMLTASAASDITPQYTNNSSGISPTNSWTIPGQNTVINHQGGDTTNGWDKNSSWNGDSSDTSKSYLKFGTDTSNPDYQIRKYAKETSTPGLYDVYLNVKGNEVKNIKPIDIVLVVDMSGSMNSSLNGGNDRVGATRQGVKNFLKTINDAGIGKYVNVGVVGFSSPGYISSSGTLSENIDSSDNQAHITRINDLLANEFKGGTFTQLGIRTGQSMLASDSNDHKKMMIMLTDGVPTFSYKVSALTNIGGIDYGTAFGTKRDEPGNTSQLSSNYYVSNGNGIVKDTWTATLGEARIAKNSGTELHALGIQIGADKNYLTKDQVRDKMLLLASSGLYQDANSASDVTTYLNNQAKDVLSQFNTVNQGTISDPLGSQFIYGDDTPTVKSVGNSVVQNLPTVTKSNGSIAVSNMNLGKDQEVQIHYQVHLNTESDNFQPDYWYQMNGKTTFTPTKDSNAVEFGVPSAKAPGTAIKVTKQWQELVDSSKRPDSINFNVTRTVNNQSTNWQASGILSKSDDWTKTFKQLTKNNQSVWLPAYDNNGNTFNYQVSSEATDGYISSITNKTNESTITNTQYGLIIDKYASNSTNKLTGAEFIVKSSDGKQSYTLTDNQLQQLTPGDYTIQETKSPKGYQLDSTVYPITLSQDGKWSSSGQGISVTSPTTDGNGYKDGFSIATDTSNNPDKNNVVRFVKNDALKKFDLTVNKVDKTTGNALKGAKFTLTDSAGKTSSYKETDPTATFTFENLSSGTYTLKETKAPDGYITSQDVTIVISDDGNVNVTNNNGDWKSTLQNDAGNNQISLTVNNTNKTVFPSTGGSGNELYLIVGGIFILIAALAGGYYVFRIKRGYRS